MTTYLGDKAVGIGTIKATKAVAGDVLHDNTLKGNGNTEPLGVDTEIVATNAYVSNAVITLNAAIDGVDEAIAKTRNDYEVADQEIRADMNEKDAELEHIITEHAEELVNLRGNQASLGDQVSVIESKIPESASEINHLITKQQLLDEEMDIRDDLNGSVSELQTQITHQATEIAGKQDELVAGAGIKIDGNVISATGGGGSASIVCDDTLTGDGTDASPLGVAKNLSVEELTVGTDEGTLNMSITAGVATIATNNGLDIVSQTKFDKAPTTDDNTTWANALDTSLVSKRQVAAALAESGGGDYLPLSGGELTGPLSIKKVGYDDGASLTLLRQGSDTSTLYKWEFIAYPAATMLHFRCNKINYLTLSESGIYSSSAVKVPLGASTAKWTNVYTTNINNGADIAIPTTGGTMALKEDIDEVVGDISTALTAILGE